MAGIGCRKFCIVSDCYPARLNDLRAEMLVTSESLLANNDRLVGLLHDWHKSQVGTEFLLAAETLDVDNLNQQCHGRNTTDTGDTDETFISLLIAGSL